MVVDKWSTYDDDGGYLRGIEYEEGDSQFDSVVVRVPPEEDDMFTVHCFQGDEDEPSYENAFEMRDLSFDPISVLGRGESEHIGGVSASNADYEGVPRDAMKALNAIGLAVVPQGRWWLDAVGD